MASRIKIQVNLENLKRTIKRLKNPQAGLVEASKGAIVILKDKWESGKGADGKKFAHLKGTAEYLEVKSGVGITVDGKNYVGANRIDMKLTGKMKKALIVEKKMKKNEVAITFNRSEESKAKQNAKKRPNLMKLGNERKMRKKAKDIFFKFLTR